MTQKDKILGYLKTGEAITALDALNKFGCLRLASRILELKDIGYIIKSATITLLNGKRVSSYWMSRGEV